MATVLVVDDAAVDRKLVSGLLAKQAGLQVELAASGDEALARLETIRPELIVTDLVMPGMSGLDLVAQIVQKHPEIPVILMTGKGSEEIAVKALEAGAASYVPKAALHQHLVATVEDVLDMVRQRHQHARLMGCLKRGQFSFTLGNDAALIPSLINYVQSLVSSIGLCDEADVIRVCIALEEALRNALFHGNLELTSEQREGDTDVYQELVEHRTRREPYASRKLHVTVDVTPQSGRFVICDEGPGFDPKKLPDPTDPENLERVSGRGLLLMRTFMDDVAFNATGNEVTMLKRCQAVGAAKEVPLMPESQHVRTEQQGDVLVVWPLFTFATFTQPDVSSEWTDVQNQLEAPAVKHVVVDLSQIPYFGSTVLEWMVQMWKRIKDKGGKLATCNPSPIGREVLTAAHFDKLWGVFDTRDEALKWLAGGKGSREMSNDESQRTNEIPMTKSE